MNIMFNAMKYRAPKNQYKIQRYIQLIASFANETSDGDDTGMRWLFKQHFIEKAGDFILGKKSPLWREEDCRQELNLGGYNPPNLGPLIGLITKMIQSPLRKEYPLNEVEEEMIMAKELL